MEKRRGIVWFRNDLRLHDNEALTEALTACDEIIVVYVFDDRMFQEQTSYGFPKTGANRCQFIIDSVEDLRSNFDHKFNGQLVVRAGLTEDILFDLAHKYKTSWVFCNRERTKEEIIIQDAVEERLWSIGQELRYNRGKMLLYTSDLPFPITHAPDQFSTFKKEVLYIPIRTPLPVPKKITCTPLDEAQDTVFDLNYFNLNQNKKSHFIGGETEGLLSLNQLIKNLKNSNHGAFLKLSPWISHGCLSPKKIYHEIKACETRANKSMISDIFIKLLRRDYFRFMGKKYGNKIFLRAGIQEGSPPGTRHTETIDQWLEARTGNTLVDSAIKALKETGYLTYPFRVLISSYFIYQLKQDWIVGAEFMESLLIDYDPCSNYGNWNRMAGVAASKQEDVKPNFDHQARLLDPDGSFVKLWS